MPACFIMRDRIDGPGWQKIREELGGVKRRKTANKIYYVK